MVKKIKEIKESVLKEINKPIPTDRVMDDEFDEWLSVESEKQN